MNSDYLFLVITLMIGFTMILIFPIKMLSLDEGAHYKMSLDDSYFGNAKITLSDKEIIDYGPRFIEHNLNPSKADLKFFNENDKVVIETRKGFSVSHIVNGMGLLFGRLLRLNFRGRFVCGEFFGLLLYLGICFYGITR